MKRQNVKRQKNEKKMFKNASLTAQRAVKVFLKLLIILLELLPVFLMPTAPWRAIV